MNMDDAEQKLEDTKDMNEANLQEHTYCQAEEGTKLKDCDIENVSDNTPMVQGNEKLDENSSINTNLGKKLVVNKKNEGDGCNGNIYSGKNSKKTEMNACKDGKDVCSDINKEGDSVEKSNHKNVSANWAPATISFGKRKSHKSYVISWGTQISCYGFAKCLIETCNFISLDLQTMQDHYKTCDGIPNYDFNLCRSCNSWLPTDDELISHESRCKGKRKYSLKTSQKEKESDDAETNQSVIKNHNDISCVFPISTGWRNLSEEDNTQMSTEGVKYCDECDQEFFSDTDYSQHLICKKNSGERWPIITKTKRKEAITSVTDPVQENVNDEDGNSPIVQAGWHIPKGEYVRRRAYTKQHRTAWENSIDKYKYVKCIFQNCHFLALSVEDMISHYGYCNGDGSFAKYVCPFCEGRLTNKHFLELHVRRSHGYEQYDENYFTNLKSLNVNSYASYMNDNKESSGDDQMCVDELGFPGEAPLEVEVTEGSPSFYCPGKMPSNQSVNEEQVRECEDLRQGHKPDDFTKTRAWRSPCEYPHGSVNPRPIQCSAVEDLNLLKEHNPESSAADNSQDNFQKIQYAPKISNDRDNNDDHIYSKRKFKRVLESESKDSSFSVMKNKNLKHYLGRKHMNEEILRMQNEETLSKNDGNNKNEIKEELKSHRTASGSDVSGKHVRRTAKSTFPITQKIIKREIQPSYTTLWTDSIKTNGFARCLVATCNFISLDIFHIENHFKNCNGVPEKGPNLCTFCQSRLPSAVELWIHKSMCKANGEANTSSSEIYQSSGECREDHVSIDSRIGEGSSEAETENRPGPQENMNNSSKESDSTGAEVSPKKEKMNSLRISDILKLKDNGTMDYNRIIQPGPIMPKGHYVRRRSYTKTHKAVWESALQKHKYVKCIFQNCHFLAMSLEDMIYHFGYCIGDGSFAKYECPYCGGRVTTKVVLDIHIQISHPDKAPTAIDQNLLTSNERGKEMLPYTLLDWKKLMARKELKTYSKNTPRPKKGDWETEVTVKTEQLSETSQDGCTTNDAAASQERERETQVATEAEVDKDSDVNNPTSDSKNSEVGNSKKSKKSKNNNGSNKSSESQTPRAQKTRGRRSSSKTNKEKSQAITANVTDKRKSVDEVDVPDESGVCKDAYENVGKPKKLCRKKEKSNVSCDKKDKNTPGHLNVEEKASEANANVASVVLEENSNTKKQETENEKKSLQKETKVESKESNKNDQNTKNDTELKRKRGRKPKSSSKEGHSEKGHVKEGFYNSDAEGASHEANDPEGYEKPCAKLAKIEPPKNQSNPNETPDPVIRKRGRPPKRKLSESKELEVEVKEVGEDKPEHVNKGKRGRKRKAETQEKSENVEKSDANCVKCAKCGLETKRRQFNDHNYKKHVGLSWIEGETPIDLNEEGVVSRNIKQAFKYVKSATCGNCGSVKKSALGFISHVQNCGKSEEEKDALKVTCPHCPARVLKYSLPMHLKLSHSEPDGNKLSKENVLDEEQPSKRKSALKAANKFGEVFKQEGDVEETKKKLQYDVYEKGVSKFPKLPCKVRGLWNRLVKMKKKIPCRRSNCHTESSTMQEAKSHYFLCPELPQKSFLCQLCEYFADSKSTIQQHVDVHSKADGDFTLESDEEKLEEEVEMKDIEDEETELLQNKSKNSANSSEDSALEASYKAKFFVRERLLNERQTRFCRRSLRMTLESEKEEAIKFHHIFPELHTEASDWIPVEPEKASHHFPSLEESISFRVYNNKKKSGSDWKQIKRFMGEIVEDSAVIFTGGSILSVSWCKYSCVRSFKQTPKQYLAVSSSKKMDKFQNIHEERKDTSGLIQIYSCGQMKTLNSVGQVPRMAMGIVHDYGEVWDLSWFPMDTFEDYGNKTFLTRIGLLAAACQDGTIRIWPICDPDELKPLNSLPIYKIHPKVILELEDKPNVGCLRLAIGRTGIITGGYASGLIAVWSLKNISSPFCKKDGESFILKPHISFQAHKTSITALSICQNSDRYISTSGLDRFIKFWDLECTGNPFESLQKEVCLDNVWPKQWPLTISTFENIVPCSGKGMIKAIRDVYCDKHRTPLVLEGTCWSLSFNEWLNILCGCNNIGDVKVRFMRNMFLADEKFRYRSGNVFCTTELKFLKEVGNEKVQETADVESSKGSGKKNAKKVKENSAVPRTYEEAHQYFGLVFHDFAIEDDSKPKSNSAKASKRDGQCIEEYPIASVNKVCWNPNYKQFMQLAIGHHCGIIRIKPLNDSKSNEEVLRFLGDSDGEISKIRME